MRRVVVSPHPDDAVWSCGGVFDAWTADGNGLTVVTVFDGDGLDDGPAPAGPDLAPPALRRQEDLAALARWRLAAVSLGLPEALRRRDPDARPRYPGLLALRRAPHPLDAPLVDLVANGIRPLLDRCDELVVPLAVHTHVDHRLARKGAERAAASVPSSRVLYYAEFPYPALPPGELVEHRRPAELDPWLAAALRYQSQVTAMFGDDRRFAAALTRHAVAGAAGAGWRYWTRPATPPGPGSSAPQAAR